MDKYLMGREWRWTASSTARISSIPGIMEHVERAGVHSGDSISVYPPYTLSQKHRDHPGVHRTWPARWASSAWSTSSIAL